LSMPFLTLVQDRSYGRSMVVTDRRRLVPRPNVTEHFSLKFAWDVFNMTNSVRFDTNSLDNGSNDGRFGLYSGTLTTPRVQQFSLRLTF
jgi:hypothetical protein